MGQWWPTKIVTMDMKQLLRDRLAALPKEELVDFIMSEAFNHFREEDFNRNTLIDYLGLNVIEVEIRSETNRRTDSWQVYASKAFFTREAALQFLRHLYIETGVMTGKSAAFFGYPKKRLLILIGDPKGKEWEMEEIFPYEYGAAPYNEEGFFELSDPRHPRYGRTPYD